jgi:AraC-like DNA-binding protein
METSGGGALTSRQVDRGLNRVRPDNVKVNAMFDNSPAFGVLPLKCLGKEASRGRDLATLARTARLSVFHFCRAFKQSFGVPPHRYHTNRRIEHAKLLLAERKHSVTEVGLSVGFSETSAFAAVFRKVTGQTPSRYHCGFG